MMTIFDDFRQFLAKQIKRFSQKINVVIKFLRKLAVVWSNNTIIFANFLGKNIFLNHNIGPM
jgi:hypothetical protein